MHTNFIERNHRATRFPASRIGRARRRLLVAALVFACALPASLTFAQSDSPLAEERWEEYAFGLSLRPPKRAQTYENTSEGAVAHFYVEEEYDIRVFIHQNAHEEHVPVSGLRRNAMNAQDLGTIHSERAPGVVGDESGSADEPEQRQNPRRPLKLKKLLSAAARQVGVAQTNARILEEKIVQIGKYDAGRIVYRIPSRRGADWVLAQVFIRIDPFTFVRFELESHLQFEDRAMRAFDAMLDSVELAEPEALNKERKQWINAGKQWLDTLTYDQLKGALGEDQWLRIVQDNKDVGWMHIQHEAVTRGTSKELSHSGVRITVRQRLHTDDGIFDTISEFFESEYGQTGIWDIRTTQRKAAPKMPGLPGDAAGARQQSWAVSGVRSKDTLTVSTDGPVEIDINKWDSLPETYLTQVRVRLLPSLLPHDRERMMGFYAYDPQKREITLRTYHVVPMDTGGYRVHIRPSPHHGVQVATYDANGRLVQRRMADGRVMISSSKDRIRMIWSDRGNRNGRRGQ